MSFTSWLDLFPPGVELVRLQLPGREDRVAEPPLCRQEDAVSAVLPALAGLTDRPVALYGHSMGAVLAFELARALTAAGTPPVHLFVSGRRAPHLRASRAVLHRLDDDDLYAALQRIGGAGRPLAPGSAFRRYTLELTRADLELNDEYVHRPEPRLQCPVTAFSVTEDPVVDIAEVQAWRDETDGPFVLHTWPGGDHFFPHRLRARLAAIMNQALDNSLRQAGDLDDVARYTHP